jgi:hypothetical protein
VGNRWRYESADCFPQYGIDTKLNTGSEVVARYQPGTADRGPDAPLLLRRQCYIDTDFQKRRIRKIGFRKILYR